MANIYGSASTLIKVRFTPFNTSYSEVPNFSKYVPPKSKVNIIPTSVVGAAMHKLPGEQDNGQAQLSFWHDTTDSVHTNLEDCYDTHGYVEVQETLPSGRTNTYMAIISDWAPGDMDNNTGIEAVLTLDVSGDITKA